MDAYIAWTNKAESPPNLIMLACWDNFRVKTYYLVDKKLSKMRYLSKFDLTWDNSSNIPELENFHHFRAHHRRYGMQIFAHSCFHNNASVVVMNWTMTIKVQRTETSKSTEGATNLTNCSSLSWNKEKEKHCSLRNQSAKPLSSQVMMEHCLKQHFGNQ